MTYHTQPAGSACAFVVLGVIVGQLLPAIRAKSLHGYSAACLARVLRHLRVHTPRCHYMMTADKVGMGSGAMWRERPLERRGDQS